MKKIFILLLSILLLASVSGCTKETAPKPDGGTEESIPLELLGYYYDEIAGRGVLNLYNAKGMEADAQIRWSSSAFESNVWKMRVTFDGKQFTYKDGSMITVALDEEGEEEKQIEVYTDGTGSFEVGEEKLIWHDDKKSASDEDVVFVRDYVAEDAGMVNPWLETDNISAAIKNAGIEFDPPISEALPSGDHAVVLKTYISTPDVIAALYQGGSNELLIRKSYDVTGRDLAGDHNEYSKKWDENYKGLNVHCEGDGKTINLAYFEVEDAHYTFSFNVGKEGQGLTVDEVGSLIMGMNSTKPLK